MQYAVLQGQSFLAADYTTAPPNGIVSINLLTCETTPVASNLNIGNFVDFWMEPSGLIYLLGFGPGPNYTPTLYAHDTATGTTSALISLPGSGTTLQGLGNGELIIQAGEGFYTYDIAGNTLTTIATVPGFNGFGEFFEYNGALYINGNTGVFEVVLSPFDLIPASLSGYYAPLVTVCGNVFGAPFGTSAFGEINVADGTSNWLCFDDFNNSTFGSFAPDPFNSTGPLCDCVTESGTFEITSSFVSNCSFNPIPLPFNNDETLDGNDNLVFVIATWDYTAYPDVQYNIIATYSDPVATFIPGVTEPGEYYLAFAMAADAVGNTIDLNDPCLEVSDYVPIVWAESPTVSFSGELVLCENGCQTIDVEFTGSSPFTLTYRVIAGTDEQVVSQTFETNSGSIVVCPPAGYFGAVTVNAEELSDSNCDCEQ